MVDRAKLFSLSRERIWLFAMVLVLATIFVYRPAWNGSGWMSDTTLPLPYRPAHPSNVYPGLIFQTTTYTRGFGVQRFRLLPKSKVELEPRQDLEFRV